MTSSNRLGNLLLLAAGLAVVAIAITRLRLRHQLVTSSVQQIHDQLDALDPLTRGAVIARLTADAARDVHSRLAPG